MQRRRDDMQGRLSRRRKRYLKRRMTATFAVLALITAVGVTAALFASSRKQDSGKDPDAIAANADVPEKSAQNDPKEEAENTPIPREENEAGGDIGGAGDGAEAEGAEAEPVQASASSREGILEEANRLAASYDYDGAMEKVKSFSGYESDQEMTDAIADYEARKAECVPVDIDKVTHVFYHSLAVDPVKCFGSQDTVPQAVGNNQWMTTVDEFNKITQEMYDRGYVMVDLHDLVEETVDENGVSHFTEGKIMLPPDKKAFVLSLDDLSYYHSYDNFGFASKMVLDENGKPTCEYIQDDGTTVVGDYDVVPLMDKFIEAHPDASYRGAKGTIALTGYNGILGYRTDISYQTQPDDLDADKKKWLEEHPDFDLETERANAKKVADALKADGWKFASHTWGHLKVGTISFERLQTDTEKWLENVAPLIGGTDTIIFAHGEDLAGWTDDYAAGNEKYDYLKSKGFNFYCNVDSKQYNTIIRDGYVRQSRRNLDGYRIYFNTTGEMDNLSDLFHAADIIDPKRPPVHHL